MAASRGRSTARIGAVMPPSLWPISATRSGSTSARANRKSTHARASAIRSS
jgi:hypothetical protein